MLKRMKKKVISEDLPFEDYDDNSALHWQDTEEYFEQTGITETYHETTRYDNDWN
tara:strand:- start:1015 stop:1179 length:165 start_codon:yes stop_codon:yes gene_type:complete